MTSRYLSRHVDNDDLRHFRFERQSGLPIGYFRDPAEAVRAWFVRWRWVAIAALLLALMAAVWVHADRPDEAIRVTARAAR